jgi:predicted component of viral defense system (DUF524 family)
MTHDCSGLLILSVAARGDTRERDVWPDLVRVTVQKHWLQLDAKYRLEPANLTHALHDTSAEVLADTEDDQTGCGHEISRLHQCQDLFRMRTYRDGILSARCAPTFCFQHGHVVTPLRHGFHAIP